MITTLLAVVLAAGAASAQERRIQLEDLTKFVNVSDPPDLARRQVHRLRGVTAEFRRKPLRTRTGLGGCGHRCARSRADAGAAAASAVGSPRSQDAALDITSRKLLLK
jgi:hypothetical protein